MSYTPTAASLSGSATNPGGGSQAAAIISQFTQKVSAANQVSDKLTQVTKVAIQSQAQLAGKLNQVAAVISANIDATQALRAEMKGRGGAKAIPALGSGGASMSEVASGMKQAMPNNLQAGMNAMQRAAAALTHKGTIWVKYPELLSAVHALGQTLNQISGQIAAGVTAATGAPPPTPSGPTSEPTPPEPKFGPGSRSESLGPELSLRKKIAEIVKQTIADQEYWSVMGNEQLSSLTRGHRLLRQRLETYMEEGDVRKRMGLSEGVLSAKEQKRVNARLAAQGEIIAKAGHYQQLYTKAHKAKQRSLEIDIIEVKTARERNKLMGTYLEHLDKANKKAAKRAKKESGFFKKMGRFFKKAVKYADELTSLIADEPISAAFDWKKSIKESFQFEQQLNQIAFTQGEMYASEKDRRDMRAIALKVGEKTRKVYETELAIMQKGIKSRTKATKLTLIGMRHGKMLGVDTKKTAEWTRKWSMELGIADDHLIGVADHIEFAARTTGLTGDALAEVVESSYKFMTNMRNAGTLTEEAMGNMVKLAGEAKKLGVEEPMGKFQELLTTGPTGFIEALQSGDKMARAMLMAADRIEGISVQEVMSGRIARDTEKMAELSRGMAELGDVHVKADLRGFQGEFGTALKKAGFHDEIKSVSDMNRAMDKLDPVARGFEVGTKEFEKASREYAAALDAVNVANLKAGALFNMGADEYGRFVEAQRLAGMSFSDRMAEIHQKEKDGHFDYASKLSEQTRKMKMSADTMREATNMLRDGVTAFETPSKRMTDSLATFLVQQGKAKDIEAARAKLQNMTAADQQKVAIRSAWEANEKQEKILKKQGAVQRGERIPWKDTLAAIQGTSTDRKTMINRLEDSRKSQEKGMQSISSPATSWQEKIVQIESHVSNILSRLTPWIATATNWTLGAGLKGMKWLGGLFGLFKSPRTAYVKDIGLEKQGIDKAKKEKIIVKELKSSASFATSAKTPRFAAVTAASTKVRGKAKVTPLVPGEGPKEGEVLDRLRKDRAATPAETKAMARDMSHMGSNTGLMLKALDDMKGYLLTFAKWIEEQRTEEQSSTVEAGDPASRTKGPAATKYYTWDKSRYSDAAQRGPIQGPPTQRG